MPSESIVFSTESYRYMAEEIARQGNFALGKIDRKVFPDSERYYRILESIQDAEVVLIGGTISDRDTLELFDLGSALVGYGARRLTLIIPYFGYSTMERAILAGEVVMAKSRARLLSSIPEASAGNRIVLLDLHSEGLPYYFDGHVRPVHLYAKQLVLDKAMEIGGRDFVFACTDAGRAKWVESLANEVGVDAAFVYKRRLDGERTQVSGVNANVIGRKIVIYDDMIRTGSSLLKAAQAYREAGAAEISAITTHGLFPGNALEVITQSGLLKRLVCTDSHPRAVELAGDRLEVLPLTPLLVPFLMG